MRVSRLLPGLLAGVLLLGGVGAASAATARASAAITIYDGPGYYYAPIGRLASGEVVKLSECTPSGRWCRVVHDGPDGWVLASYLVGSAAKVDATPFRPLVRPRFDLFRHRFPAP